MTSAAAGAAADQLEVVGYGCESVGQMAVSGGRLLSTAWIVRAVVMLTGIAANLGSHISTGISTVLIRGIIRSEPSSACITPEL